MTGRATTPARRARRRRTTTKPSARSVQRQAKKVVTNPWVERSARAGYIVRGLLYGTMGVLALGLAVGLDAGTTDQRGALELLGGSAVGRLFMLVVVIALLAYSGWGVIRAVYDPLHRGDDPPGIASRIGFAWSALNYAVLAVFAAGLLLGASSRQRRRRRPEDRRVGVAVACGRRHRHRGGGHRHFRGPQPVRGCLQSWISQGYETQPA